MSDKDDHPGGTLPSLVARKPGVNKPPGEELPFESEGRYQPLGEDGKERVLGRGGLGRVLLTRDVHLQREVAVKEMLPEVVARGGSAADAIAERFLREARITAQLEHPGVVPVYELGKRNDGSLYYAMKRVQGRTLANALEGCATLDERLSLMPHFLDVVQTVAFAHSRQVVHRDLKPENVMIGAFGETQVVDWGLARAGGVPDLPLHTEGGGPAATLGDRPANLHRDPESGAQALMGGRSVTQTVVGKALGTPKYMSPEQAQGKVDQMDAQSDVWSLGVMLFELLTGRTPFEGTSSTALILAVVNDPIPSIAGLEPKAPPALIAVARKALQRDRTLRYASAMEVADALVAALDVHAGAPRRPLGWLALTAALLVVAVTGLVKWRASVDASVEAQAAAQRRQADSELQLALATAERAQAKWEAGDVYAASKLATEALTHAEVPLARGVQSLVRLSGAPVKVWSVTVPGGCTTLAARAGVVACATLGGVVLYDPAGKELGTLSPGTAGWQRAVAFLDTQTLATGGDERLIRFWNADTLRQTSQLDGLASEVRVLTVSPEGDLLLAGLRNGDVLRHPMSGRESDTVARHAGAVRALAVKTGPLAVASSAHDGVDVFRSLRFAGEPAELRFDRPASALLFSGSGLVVAVERDLFELFGRTRWSGHLGEITALAATRTWPLISGSADGTVRAWIDGAPIAVLSEFPSGVSALAPVVEWAGGPDFYVATRGRTLEGWQWPRDARTPALPELGLEPTAATVAPDGTVYAGFRDGSVKHLVGARNALEVLPARKGDDAPVHAVAALDRLALWGDDLGKVSTWTSDTGPRELDTAPQTHARAVALSRDSERAAWSYDDGTRVVWSLKFGKEISHEKDVPVNVLAFSPDGATLAAGLDDKSVLLLDAATGKQLKRLEGHDGAVQALAFSPDGATLATGAADKRVTLWELSTGQARAQLVAAQDRIGALTFSADGARLVAGSDEGAVFVWDPKTARLEREVRLHAGHVLTVAFGADGRLLVAGTDRTVRWLVAQSTE